MAPVPQKVLQWLYEALKTYQDPNRTYSDAVQALSQYPSLSPRTDVYTYENGRPALLLHISGTLPVTFRNAVYKFPISIWIPHAYPREAPMVFVVPTPDMAIRPGQHVSGEGRVYHHYLAHWTDAWERSSVVDILFILRDVFAKEPPVVSKQQSSRPPPRQEARPPPIPPLPPELHRSPSPNPQYHPSHGPPPPPPKPHPAPQPPAPPNNRYSRDLPPPPLPDKPPQAYEPPTMQPIHAVSESPVSPLSPPQPNFQQVQQFPPQQYPQPGHHPSSQGNMPQMGPYQPNQYPPAVQSQHPPQYPPPSQAVAVPNQPKPKQPTIDLLSSPLDLPLPTSANHIAPPIPPNPEKDALLATLSRELTTNLHKSIAQHQSYLPALQSQQSALSNALSTVQSEISSLQTLSADLASNQQILQNSIASADRVIADAQAEKAKGNLPNVDDILVAPTVVGKQLYELVAEERGIGDAIWALQRALEAGRINLTTWAKLTRGLARERFLKEALIQKIGKGMGLETD